MLGAALLAAFLVGAQDGQAQAQVIVSGGAPTERQALVSVTQHELSRLILPDSPVTVHIVSQSRINSIVRSNNARASRDSAGSPSMADDNNSDGDVDGIYDEAPEHGGMASITLATGEDVRDLDQTFIHEYGHHVWTEFLLDRERDDYCDIYDRQFAAKALVTSYASDSPEEAFAESFSYYLLHPKMLQDRDPASYRYIQQLVPRLRAACAAIHDETALAAQHS